MTRTLLASIAQNLVPQCRCDGVPNPLWQDELLEHRWQLDSRADTSVRPWQVKKEPVGVPKAKGLGFGAGDCFRLSS